MNCNAYCVKESIYRWGMLCEVPAIGQCRPHGTYGHKCAAAAESPLTPGNHQDKWHRNA